MNPDEIQFAHNLEALAIPQCRRIVKALSIEALTRDQLAKACKLSPASIDKHLEVLVEKKLVRVRRANGVERAILQRTKLEPTLDWFSGLND